ncbi:MAG: hypothetical protein K2H87_04675 [Duncaniella sp.]|nr:hypothetical protein [Duncaniella sp.]
MKVIIPESFNVGARNYSDAGLSNGKCLKMRPVSVVIPAGDGAGTYKVCDGMATSKCKEIADALGIQYKSSWFTDRIAQEVLTSVLGDKYVKPKRGAYGITHNIAIFDDFVLMHEYENDGCGDPDSIKKGCYVYKKA